MIKAGALTQDSEDHHNALHGEKFSRPCSTSQIESYNVALSKWQNRMDSFPLCFPSLLVRQSQAHRMNYDDHQYCRARTGLYKDMAHLAHPLTLYWKNNNSRAAKCVLLHMLHCMPRYIEYILSILWLLYIQCHGFEAGEWKRKLILIQESHQPFPSCTQAKQYFCCIQVRIVWKPWVLTGLTIWECPCLLLWSEVRGYVKSFEMTLQWLEPSCSINHHNDYIGRLQKRY